MGTEIDDTSYSTFSLMNNLAKQSFKQNPSTSSIEDELDKKIGLKQNGNIEEYKHHLYEYFLRYEDLENKYNFLNRNFQEVKDALENSRRQKEDALKEKEKMTLKFATGERKSLIERQKLSKLIEENEILTQKLEAANSDKSKIRGLLDEKLQEHKRIHSAMDQIKNDNFILQNEMKLCQSALKTHADLYRESQNKIQELTQNNSNLLKEIDGIKNDTPNKSLEYKFKPSEELVKIETLLKMTQSERDLKNNEVIKLQSTLNDITAKNNEASQTIKDLLEKLQLLQLEKQHWNESVADLEKFFEINCETQTVSTVLDICKLELLRGKNQSQIDEVDKETLKLRCEQAENELDSYKCKVSELLTFTEKLTGKTVGFQSKLLAFETETKELKNERKNLKLSIKDCEYKLSRLLVDLKTREQENKRLKEEIDAMEVKLSGQKSENVFLKQKIFDQKGEMDIMKRKSRLFAQEVRRELKKTKLSEARQCGNNFAIEFHKSQSKGVCCKHCTNIIQTDRYSNSQLLVEGIYKLQRMSARKSERIDFLEDQINLLTLELEKKSKLFRNYLMREEIGDLAYDQSNNMKYDLTKFGGIMASVFGSKILDKHYNLKLSLDINHKLQAVLEDVLLQNITLKENLNKLRHEMDKMKRSLINKT